MFSKINFLKDEIDNFQNDGSINNLIILIYSLFPLFLIIGTALSELAIILLCFYFISNFFFKKENIFKNKIFYFLIFIYLALIINLIFSLNISNSFLRNLFFIKYIIFILGTINFLSKKKYRMPLLFKIWSIILTIFALDMFIQFFLGKNLVGIESPLKFHRVSGFMGDELKAGSLLLGLSLIPACFLINNGKYKNVGFLMIVLFLSAIFISGDRSNFIKSLIVISSLSFFIKKELLKKLLILFTLLITFIIIILSNFETLKDRYKNKIFSELASNNYSLIKFIDKTEYGKIYYTGIKLFQNNKFFGVGNKNFRLLCEEKFQKEFLEKNDINEEKFRCNNHPHQIYIEILSEHGLFGFSTLVILLMFFVRDNLNFIFKKKNLLLSCLFLTILINFVPILPGGSFFTSFNSTIFWLNFSLFYAIKKTINK